MQYWYSAYYYRNNHNNIFFFLNRYNTKLSAIDQPRLYTALELGYRLMT